MRSAASGNNVDTDLQSPYPIVEMRSLGAVARRGLMGVLPPRRGAVDLPRPREGHYVLVYKVDGRFLLDNVNRGPRDEQIIRATQVSTVDVRRDMPILVEFDVPSADDSTFRVRVTFKCTVTDPVLVVAEGIANPETVLESYVKTHHNAMQMGLDFDLTQIGEVRRYVDAQLTAYMAVSPPAIRGFDVRRASIEVLTPAELAELSATRRRRRIEYDVAAHDLDLSVQLEAERERLDYQMRVERESHRQDVDHQRSRYDATRAVERQRHDDLIKGVAQEEELARRESQENFYLDRMQAVHDAMGNDPDKALHIAYLAEQVSASERAEKLRDDRERKRAHKQGEKNKDRAERQQLAAELHEQRVKELEFKLERERAALAASREESRAQREAALEEKRITRIQAFIETNRQHLDETAAREDAKARLNAQFDLLRALADRGHLDSLNLDLAELVDKLSGTHGSGDRKEELPGDEKQGLTATSDAPADPAAESAEGPDNAG